MNESFVKDVLNQIVHNVNAVIAAIDGRTPGTAPAVGVENNAKAKPVCTLVNGRQRIYEDCGDGWGIVYYKGGDAVDVNAKSDACPLKKEDKALKYLTKRKDGRWQGSKMIDGKRAFVYGQTQLECYEKLKKLNKNRKKSPKTDSLAKFALWFLETYKKGNVVETTYKNYSYVVKAHLNVATPINKVSTVQLQQLLNKLPATRIRKEVYKLLRQIFRKAYELDYIVKDISAFLVLGNVVEGERTALNIEEQQKLMAALGTDMFSRRVLFYLCTGARPSEISTVQKNELRPEWVKINGTKTKNAVRWVKISQKLYDMLRGESPEFFTFNNKRFRERLQAFCHEHKICEEIDVYKLRHTFATNLYILGVAEKDRQTYMGHTAGSRLTNDVYTTFSPDVTPQDIYNIYGDFLPKF